MAVILLVVMAGPSPAAQGGAPAIAADAPSRSGDEPLRVLFFSSPICLECRQVQQLLNVAGEKWGQRIATDYRNVDEPGQYDLMLQYQRHYDSAGPAPPVLFIGGQCLLGLTSAVERLDSVIGAELAAGRQTPDLGAADTQEALGRASARLGGFTVAAVGVAGLIDGVNPCAFTTMVFLLSMLTYLGRTRRQMVAVGAGFTVAIFVTYLLLGLGLMVTVKAFAISRGVSQAMAVAVGIFALGLSAWSLVDFVRYKRGGKVHRMTLGLPLAVKQRMHRVIRVGLGTRSMVLGALGVGFVVALLESICTGQVYLPTIVFVVRAGDSRMTALSYLLLYNLMFILPLVGVFGIAYYGVSSKRIGEWLRTHIGALKLTMAALFAGLGILVLSTL